MALSFDFDKVAVPAAKVRRPAQLKVAAKRPSPFSLRLSADERAKLLAEARDVPLGAYIKDKLLGDASGGRGRKSARSVADQQALAQAVARLGQSQLWQNLGELAHAAHIGALPLTPEIEQELSATIAEVRAIRRDLVMALGLKGERAT
jgi:hypothetical protein